MCIPLYTCVYTCVDHWTDKHTYLHLHMIDLLCVLLFTQPILIQQFQSCLCSTCVHIHMLIIISVPHAHSTPGQLPCVAEKMRDIEYRVMMSGDEKGAGNDQELWVIRIFLCIS